jgi:hypothetical protein
MKDQQETEVVSTRIRMDLGSLAKHFHLQMKEVMSDE